MLAHNGGPNYSSGIRKMIYFRLRYNFEFKSPSQVLCNNQFPEDPDGSGLLGNNNNAAAADCVKNHHDTGTKSVCSDSSNLQSSQNMLPIPNCSSWDEIVEAQKNDIWFDLPRLKFQVEKLKNMMSAAL